MHLCLFEDSYTPNFYPLVYLRPVFDLRCGARTLLQRAEVIFGRNRPTLLVRQEIASLVQEIYPSHTVNQIPKDGSIWLINARLVIEATLKRLVNRKINGSRVFTIAGETAVAYLTASELDRYLAESTNGMLSNCVGEDLPREELEGRLVSYPWDLVHGASKEITADAATFSSSRKGVQIYPGAYLINKKHVYIGKGSIIKPGAVLDAEHGPIIIGRNVIIMPNAVIEGPAFIGDHSLIKIGAKIYHGTSIGEWCKVGGEVEASIMQSYSNKQHDGFLGHSYLGSWVNLGADTNTSDLKNTYGNIRVSLDDRQIDTGMQFVGLTMGDHSKSGINVMFDTGTVVGISSNIYGAGLPPKYVPSFSWGSSDSLTTYDLEKSLETARRVMLRRNVTMSDAYETVLKRAYEMTERERMRHLRK